MVNVVEINHTLWTQDVNWLHVRRSRKTFRRRHPYIFNVNIKHIQYDLVLLLLTLDKQLPPGLSKGTTLKHSLLTLRMLSPAGSPISLWEIASSRYSLFYYGLRNKTRPDRDMRVSKVSRRFLSLSQNRGRHQYLH